VGVHNGWTFVSKPHIVVLEPEFAGQVKMGNRANSMSSLKGIKKLRAFNVFVVDKFYSGELDVKDSMAPDATNWRQTRLIGGRGDPMAAGASRAGLTLWQKGRPPTGRSERSGRS
jgi:hypothetical protein